VIGRNGSERKYVEIVTHRVGSIGALSRRTNTKELEVCKIVWRNMKANIFPKESTWFKATIDLNKKKSVSVYVKIVDLIPLRHQYTYMEHRGKKYGDRRTLTSAGCAHAYGHQLKWSNYKVLRHIPTWTWLKCSTYRHSREENL
jgi:hypothetical protein